MVSLSLTLTELSLSKKMKVKSEDIRENAQLGPHEVLITAVYPLKVLRRHEVRCMIGLFHLSYTKCYICKKSVFHVHKNMSKLLVLTLVSLGLFPRI